MGQTAIPHDRLADLLKEAFPTLTETVPVSVTALAVRRRTAPGEVVCAPDRPVEALTLVLSGSLRLEKDGHTIRDFGVGDYFGEGRLFRAAPPNVTITVMEEAELVELPSNRLHDVLVTEPAFSVNFMQALLAETMGRLQATNQLFADNRSLAQQLTQAVRQLDGALALVQDSEERMRFLASHDPLTH